MTIASERSSAVSRLDLALLTLRVAIGVVFVGHGAQKLFGLFGGGGLADTARMMSASGLEPGLGFAVLGGTIEFGGGLLVLCGLLTRLAALLLTGTMVMAIILVTGRNGFFIQNQGYEFNLALIAVAVTLVIVGAGRLSLDSWLDLDARRRSLWRQLRRG